MTRLEAGATDLPAFQRQWRRLRRILRWGLFDKLLRRLARKYEADEDEFVERAHEFLDEELDTDLL